MDDDTLIKENENKSNTLSDAKDRAQITAAGAMSIVNVALLKEVLANDAETRYRNILLCLITTCLALQIFAGLVAIFVAQLRSYYTKYRRRLCDDLAENLCCCRLMRKREIDCGEQIIDIWGSELDDDNMNESEPTASKMGATHVLLGTPTKHFRAPEHDENVHDDRLCNCCPFKISTRLMSDAMLKIMDQSEIWRQQTVRAELVAAEANINVTYLEGIIAKSRARLEEIGKDKDKEPNPVEVSELETNIADAQARRDAYTHAQRRLAILKKQDELLWEKADIIRKNRVLKQVFFWQNMINYMLYIVFIMNAFITGLWVVTPVVGGDAEAAPGGVGSVGGGTPDDYAALDVPTRYSDEGFILNGVCNCSAFVGGNF